MENRLSCLDGSQSPETTVLAVFQEKKDVGRKSFLYHSCHCRRWLVIDDEGNFVPTWNEDTNRGLRLLSCRAVDSFKLPV